MRNRKPSSPFHAIIIGGSVSGLTLAHTFVAANISYTLLEARDTISPQVGASIVIMPNGARILDQLGIYDKLEKEIMTPMKRTFVRRGEGEDASIEDGVKPGTVLGVNEWTTLVHERWVLIYLEGLRGRLK
jgi:2-polyprenyl-6-methoxyphenol hydroxylase-like FAD-dependent oxidoreductase